jgi:hypothetical protein
MNYVNKYLDAPINGRSGREEYYEFFRCDIAPDGTRLGEDVYFSVKYRSAGGKMWIEPRINFEHWGSYMWEGNYDTYLRQLPKEKLYDSKEAV